MVFTAKKRKMDKKALTKCKSRKNTNSSRKQYDSDDSKRFGPKRSLYL